MAVHPELMAIICCPKCHGKVTEQRTDAGEGLVCAACKLVYSVVDDVPNFLIDEARPLT